MENTSSPKPDWIASSLHGQLKNTSVLPSMGLSAEDFDMKPADDYWGTEAVKTQFQNDRSKFDEFYSKEAERRNQAIESDKSLKTYFEVAKLSPLDKKGSVTISSNKPLNDIWGRDIVYGDYTEKKYTWKEKANTVGVRLSSGNYVKPSEFEGITRYAKDEQGALKLNEQGSPYLEPLNEGEELRSFDETYSKTNDLLGIYGLNQNFLQTATHFTVKNAVNFFADTVDSLLEYPRAALSPLGDSAQGGVDSIANIQNQARNWKIGNTETQDEAGFFSISNLADVGAQAMLQLLSMGGITRTAAALGAGKYSSTAGRIFMTGISAAPLAKISREHGLTPMESAALLAITTIPLYQISAISDKIVKGMSPLTFKSKLEQQITEAFEMTLKDKPFNKVSLGSYLDVLKNKTASLSKFVDESAPIVATGFWESIEEVLEQTVDVGARYMYDTIQPYLNSDKKFNIDWGTEFEHMVQAGAGGAIGGSFAYPLMKKMRGVDPLKASSIEDKVFLEEEGDVYSIIDKMRKDKRLEQKDYDFLKAYVDTAVTIRERSGVKGTIYNNEKVAGRFKDAIKSSSLGADMKEKSFALYELEEKLVKMQTLNATDEEVVAVNKQIEILKNEINNITKGNKVNRYVTEGLYNLLFDKTELKAKDYVSMNENVKSDREKIKLTNDLKRQQLMERDATATFDDFKGITERGAQRLTAELIEERNALRPAYDIVAEEINASGLIGELFEGDPQDILSNSLDLGQLFVDEDIEKPLEELKAQFSPDAIKVLGYLYDNARKQNNINKEGKVKEPVESNDDIYLNEIGSEMPIETALDYEELASKNEKDLYNSVKPKQLLDIISKRIEQVQANIFFQSNPKYKDVINPGVENPESVLRELILLKGRASELDNKVNINQSNVGVALNKYFTDILKVHYNTLENVVAKANSFSEVKILIDALPELNQLIRTGNNKEYTAKVALLEKAFFDSASKKKDEILKSFEVYNKDERWSLSEEATNLKNTYDYIRGVLSVDPNIIYSTLYESLNDNVGVLPSDEQQWMAINTVRAALAGEYKWHPTYTENGPPVNDRSLAMSYSAGINGKPGSGKTSSVAPLVVDMISKITKGKAIVTAHHTNQSVERVKNVEDSVVSFFGKKPEYMKSSTLRLDELLMSRDIEDVNVILYDEAALIRFNAGKDSYNLQSIQSLIDKENKRRANDRNAKNKYPLHLIYTYDNYQNGYYSALNSTQTDSIFSSYVHIPSTPRLSYSFRSVNDALKNLETVITKLHDNPTMKLEPMQFTHDGLDGVTIVSTEEQLETQLEKLRAKLDSDANLTAAYITVDNEYEGHQNLSNYNIQKYTSLESQGLERDYVVLDDKSGNPFNYLMSIKSFYTGATRPKKGIIIKLAPSIPWKSVSGNLVNYKALSDIDTRRKDTLDNYKKIADSLGVKTSDYKAPVPSSTTPSSTVVQKPIEDEVKPIEIDENTEMFRDVLEKTIPNVAWLNSFFYTNNSFNLKRRLLFDPVVKNLSTYRIVIAKIGSPGYVNLSPKHDKKFDGKWGIFIEGEYQDKTSVLGLMKDSDEQINSNPELLKILNEKGSFSLPLSKEFIEKSYDHHPIIEVNSFVNGKYVLDTSKHVRRTLGEIKSELGSQIAGSNVYVATQDIAGYDGKVAVKSGDAFIVLSSEHSKAELDKLLKENPTIELNSRQSGLRTLRLDNSFIQPGMSGVDPNEVLNSYKKLMFQYPNGRYAYDFKNKKNEITDLKFKYWATYQPTVDEKGEPVSPENNEQRKFYIELFNETLESLKNNNEFQQYFENRKSLQQPFEMRNLFEEYALVQANNDAVGIKNLGLVVDTVLANPKMSGFLRFNVNGRRKSTSTPTTRNYRFMEAFQNADMDNHLSASFISINEPQIKFDRSEIINSITNATLTAQTEKIESTEGDIIQDEVVEEGAIEKYLKADDVQPMTPIEFISKEYPDNTIQGIKVLKKFRADVMASMVIREGTDAKILSLTPSLTNLKSEYTKVSTKETQHININSKANASLGRNFERLIAHYFPAFKYDIKTKTYSLSVGNKKTNGFKDNQNFDVLGDGANNIVKSYLYNTPLMELVNGRFRNVNVSPSNNGTFINTINQQFLTPTHIAMLTRQLNGFQDIDDLRAKLKNIFIVNGKPAKGINAQVAVTLYSNFFGTYSENNTPFKSMNSETAQAVSSVLEAYLKSTDYHAPGYSTLEIKKVRSFDNENENSTVSYINYNRSQSYPGPSFKGNIILQGLIDRMIYTMRVSNSSIETSSSGTSIGDLFIPIKDSYTDAEIASYFKGLGSSNITVNSLQSLFNNTNLQQSPDVYRLKLANWMRSSIDNYKKSKKEPVPSAEVSELVQQYIIDEGLGNNFSIMDMNGNRQNLMRNSNPTSRINEVIEEIRREGSEVHSKNMLVREDGGNITLDTRTGPMINTGVKTIIDGQEITKSLDRMSVDELLDVYVLDGYVSRLESGNSVFLPVTVYADSGTEYMPSFSITNPFQYDKTLEQLFESRVQIYESLEKEILTEYSKAGIQASNINELNKILNSGSYGINMFQSNPDVVVQLMYLDRNGEIKLKKEVVDAINTYKNDDYSKAKFITDTLAKADVWVEKAPDYLKKQIKAVSQKASSTEYLKSFYINQLAAASEYRAIALGNDYQFKSVVDLSKRSKALIAPGMRFLNRSNQWQAKFQEAKAKGIPLPLWLKYEGGRMNRFQKQVVVEEIPYTVQDLDDGTLAPMESLDGATFVTVLTRVAQWYSSGMNYGTFIGPVMKNVTPSKNKDKIYGNFVKNAEFEITTEMMKISTPQQKAMVKGMLNSVPFSVTGLQINNTPVNTAYEVLIALGMNEDLSNATFKLFKDAYDFMIENGVQDDFISEVVPVTSEKTAAPVPNPIIPPTGKYSWRIIDTRMKATQQDAMKDTSEGESTSVLTQLVNTLFINWSEPEALMEFTDTLAKITKDELDIIENQLNNPLERVRFINDIKLQIKNELIRKEDMNYRTEAAMYDSISIDDPLIGGLFSQKVSSIIKDRAIAYALQGGQYVIHPSNELIVAPTANGKLNFIPPVRVADGKNILQLYEEIGIEATHASLQTHEWTKGEGQIMMPAEMKSDFMLQDAVEIMKSSNKGIEEVITQDYFKIQIKKRNPKLNDSGLELLSSNMMRGFELRLKGVMTRIPTSGKHSAMVTKIVGFMNDSMNSVFVPVEMLRLQGADQDIDKGSYLTYKAIVLYHMSDGTYTLYPNHYPNKKVKSKIFTGIIPAEELGVDTTIASDLIKKLTGVKITPSLLKEIERVSNENKLVKNIIKVLTSSRSVVESNTPVDKTYTDIKRRADENSNKISLQYDDIDSLMKIHELNQAGGKNLTGVFANTAKGYNVLYAFSKITGADTFVPDLKSVDNTVWKRIAGYISATVDNAKLGILGPNEIDNITAPYVSYMLSQNMSEDDIKLWIDSNKQFLNDLLSYKDFRSGNRFSAKNYPWPSLELKAFHNRSEEFNMFTKTLVNREIPVRTEDLASYIVNLEKFVNDAFKRKDIVETFNLQEFVKDEVYADKMINLYENLIDKQEIEGVTTLSPLSNHTYNILGAFRKVPHMFQYMRGLLLSHEISMLRKDYKATYEVYSNLISENASITADSFNEISNFVKGSFITNYLNSRAFKIEGNNLELGRYEDRVTFVNSVNDRLDFMKANYPGNKFISLLEKTQVKEGDKIGVRVRLPDFFDMSEDTKQVLLHDFGKLSTNDQSILFIYNLITTRDKSSFGSFSNFVNVRSKYDFLKYLENEMNVDTTKLTKDAKAAELNKYASKRKESDKMELYIKNDVVIDRNPVMKTEEIINGVKVYSVNSIYNQNGDKFGFGVKMSILKESETGKFLIASKDAINFNHRTLQFHPQETNSDGTVGTSFKMTMFTEKQYQDFVLNSSTLFAVNSKIEVVDNGEKRLEYDAEYKDRIYKTALDKIGMKNKFKFKTTKEYNKEALACKIPVK